MIVNGYVMSILKINKGTSYKCSRPTVSGIFPWPEIIMLSHWQQTNCCMPAFSSPLSNLGSVSKRGIGFCGKPQLVHLTSFWLIFDKMISFILNGRK